MRAHLCAVCDQLLFFENSMCLGCRSPVGFDPTTLRLGSVTDDGTALRWADGTPGSFRRCGNTHRARCNWLVSSDDAQNLCRSCRLTTVWPGEADAEALAAFADTEGAKRRLLHQLLTLGLPVVDKLTDPVRGISFELRSPLHEDVTTGHQDGVVTLDLSESDDAHRTQVRQELGEAYRTVLGHLRHEIGHYYWPLLVLEHGRLDQFRELFGDERISYEDAMWAHYGNGPPTDWERTHVSSYASMHPWEDWAETFAHYLHIADGLETADGFGVRIVDPAVRAGAGSLASDDRTGVAPIVKRWLALTFGLNAMARSMGQRDLYPFVLSEAVVAKLDFVHRAVMAADYPAARAISDPPGNPQRL